MVGWEGRFGSLGSSEASGQVEPICVLTVSETQLSVPTQTVGKTQDGGGTGSRGPQERTIENID
jgi:hypothetical protein